ncbi:electron transport complex subunit E [Motilimonas cestriensis]|uniref:Ion-translocating oxidoreductase complex subunit E n=1 Tax=Motilimonas cestriensis TaxID=2742685 RepID=A0ABS8WEQ9_9GAMM|nr:electron transport complex subunit E [Motilimonas cestriensis]MCE2596807.1 electron transport complex subunit E [Motilimonas cestriensis]
MSQLDDVSNDAQPSDNTKLAQTGLISSESKEIILQGLWKNNPGLVQLLGLCPLLAVSSTVINALGLAIATTAVLVLSNWIVSLVRNHVPKEIRIPIFVMIIASLVTCIELLMHAYTYDLYLSLGIFIPLIVTNCAIIGRAEAYASKNTPTLAALDGLMMGLGFSFVLLTLGAVREVLGSGTLFYGAQALFGNLFGDITVHVFTTESTFLFAVLPPGAFVVMGFLIAVKNIMDKKA